MRESNPLPQDILEYDRNAIWHVGEQTLDYNSKNSGLLLQSQPLTAGSTQLPTHAHSTRRQAQP